VELAVCAAGSRVCGGVMRPGTHCEGSVCLVGQGPLEGTLAEGMHMHAKVRNVKGSRCLGTRTGGC